MEISTRLGSNTPFLGVNHINMELARWASTAV